MSASLKERGLNLSLPKQWLRRGGVFYGEGNLIVKPVKERYSARNPEFGIWDFALASSCDGKIWDFGTKAIWGDQRADGPENLLALRADGTRVSKWRSNVGDKTIQL